MAAHLGIIDEEAINNMSYVFFDDVLVELGHRLNYEAVSNYAGNSFCEKSWEMISDSNPFNISEDGKGRSNSTAKAIANFFGKSNIRMKDKGAKKDG